MRHKLRRVRHDWITYAIGTTAGGNNIVDWTDAGLVSEITRDGLTLSEGTTYYFSVQGGNGGGLWSAPADTNGIATPTGATVAGAKALANGQIRALRGKTVSAVFNDCFYVQEPDGYRGIKITPAASVTAGQTVDIAGTMQGQGAERYIDCAGNALTASAGPGAPAAVGVRSDSVGGADLWYWLRAFRAGSGRTT